MIINRWFFRVSTLCRSIFLAFLISTTNAFAQNDLPAISQAPSVVTSSVHNKWFISDPFKKAETIGINVAVSRMKAIFEGNSEGEDKINEEARELVSLIFEAFQNEFPKVMKDKTPPTILVMEGSPYESPMVVPLDGRAIIYYPANVWRMQGRSGNLGIIAHEMVHYLFHMNRTSSVIWLKDKDGKIFDYTTTETKSFEYLLNLFTVLELTKDENLGVFASPKLTFDLLDALEVYDAEKYCGMDLKAEGGRVFEFISEVVQLDSLNGRVTSKLSTEKIRSQVKIFEDDWRKCFNSISTVRGTNWDLRYFFGVRDLIDGLSTEATSRIFTKNPVDLVIEKLNELNSTFDGFLSRVGVNYSKLNYYTVEDQADELAAVVLQNQKIDFDRKFLLNIIAPFELPENMKYCEASLEAQKPLLRSSVFIRTHRNSCARVQRLEHYSKTLKAYPGTESFK